MEKSEKSFEDQRRLVRRIACDPFGETAQTLERILNAIPEELGSYGIVWARFLERARVRSMKKRRRYLKRQVYKCIQ